MNSNLELVRVYRLSTPAQECPWGLKAVDLLKQKNISFEDHRLTSTEIAALKAKHNVATTPQIFVGETRIGGYTDLAAKLNVKAEAAEYSYTPVVAVFSTAGLMALATATGITGFMGFSLSLLASLKLMDIESFAAGFAKYDLITKKIKLYAKIYPFAELAVGLGFLSGIAPIATGIGSLLIGLNGSISVLKAVYFDKLSLNCACVGGNSKTPLGIVSFSENAIMTIMGGILLFSSITGQVEALEINESQEDTAMELVSNQTQARQKFIP